MKKVKDLIPDDKNFNRGTEFGESLIAKSFEKFGAGRSILLDKNNKVIAGNKSLQKFAEQGGENVQIVESDGKKLIAVKRTDIDLDTPEGREMALADNATAKANIEWDFPALELAVTEFELKPLDWGVKMPHEVSEDDYVIPDEIETDIVLGDLFEIGQHRLLCGDSILADDINRLMNGSVADMVYSDPPYGANIVNANGKIGGDKPFGNIGNMRGELVKANSYKPIIGDETTETAKKAFDLCRNIDCQIWWGAQYYAEHLPPNSGWIVWDKETDGSLGDGELAYTNQKKAIRIFKHKWSGMIKASEHGEKRVHPTQKPVALAAWCFDNYGNPKIILDLFLGSGTSMVASKKKQHNRVIL